MKKHILFILRYIESARVLTFYDTQTSLILEGTNITENEFLDPENDILLTQEF
jgi:hypothetical protein